MSEPRQGIFPIVPYPDPQAAIDWLARAFAAELTARYPEDPDEPLEHAEIRVGGGIVMLNDASRRDDSPFALTDPVLVYSVVDDPDGLHERAKAAGAEILMGPTDQPYGSREFAARDLGRNVWTFGTYQPKS